MPRLVDFVFARIFVNWTGHGRVKGPDLVQATSEALSKTKPSTVRSGSETYVWFEPTKSGEYRFDRDHLVAYYCWGGGKTFGGLDLKSGRTAPFEFQAPPRRGKVLLVLSGDGDFIIQKTKGQYLQPEPVLNATFRALRLGLGMDYQVDGAILSVTDAEPIIDSFIRGLSTLTELRFADIRHSNPKPMGGFMDEAYNANISEIVERSKGQAKGGIDRTSQMVQGQLAHVREDYAKIVGVTGFIDDTRAAIRADPEEELALEIEPDTGSDADKVKAAVEALSAFKRLKEQTKDERPGTRKGGG